MPRVTVTVLVIGALLTGCGGSSTTTSRSSAPSSSITSPTPTASTSETPGTSAPAPSVPAPTVLTNQVVYQHFVSTESFGRDDLDVFAPAEIGPWPVVVAVHGGGWIIGDRSDLGQLSDGLADRGVVVFNTDYHTVSEGGKFPDTVYDVECAVAYAVTHAAEYTTTPGRVTVLGHSAGAHLAALAAFAPEVFAQGCDFDLGAGATGFVGLAGPYDTDQLGRLLQSFFGTDIAVDPTPWTAGNPFTYVSTMPDIPSLLLHGDADELVPVGSSRQLEQALADAGHRVELDVIAGATHGDLTDPNVVADTIHVFLDR